MDKLIRLIHYDEPKKRAHDFQIVKAKGHLKLSHGQQKRQVSGTNQPMKALHKGRH